MSNETYTELWKDCQTALEEVAQADTILQNAKPQKDRRKAQKIVGELYARYIVACNRLDQCYDQMIQPQKRLLVKKLLDSCIGRVLELKHELVDIELSEYTYCDDALVKYRVTPQEAEIRVPSYFTREREEEIRERRKFIEDTLRSLGHLREEAEPKKMSESEAIRLIQAHERARQGRVRFQFMKEIREMKEKSLAKTDTEYDDPSIGITAALLIQKVWRGYITRRRVRIRRIEEMLLIGMIQPSQVVTENFRRSEKVKQSRREKQVEYQKAYEQMLVETKERIRREKGSLIEERLRVEIRNWVTNYYQQTGKVPDLPAAESGGFRIMFSRQGAESTLSKSTALSSKESKKSKKSKTKKEGDGEQSEDESDPGFKPVASNFLPEIVQANADYREIWTNKDESSNPGQDIYFDMIETEKYREVEDEIRTGVDQLMRDDIAALQAAVDRDKGHKGKRGKKSQKRVRRSGKKNKRKKEKDLTPDRSTKSLFEELLTNGIIKLHPEIRLDQFKAEKSYGNSDLRDQGKDPLPALGDIRQLVTEYCILPLGNDVVRQLTPLVRSVLIAGPRGSGKKMLVHCVCTELGATLFDITPANIAGKYPGKSGLIMLLHLISKVSRILQPSVIFMDGAERPFVKKVPKTDRTDPKRLKKDLPKLVKGITADDRVILIGTTNSPWDCDQKLLYQTYDKVIFVPRPDHGTMSSLWKDLLYKDAPPPISQTCFQNFLRIFQYSGISRQFDTSAMTKICDGFTVGTVLQSINEVMTTKRMVQLRVHPLTHAELVNALSTKDPVYREEEEAFLAWYSKTPTCRRKQRAIELELEKLDEANEKKRKGKK